MKRRGQGNLLSLGKLAALDTSLKAALRQSCAECGLSREQIVDRANELASAACIRLNGGNASELSTATLDKWLAPTAMDKLPPARALVVLCEVTGDVEPLSVLAEAVRGRVINEDQAKVLRIAELDTEIKRLQKQKRQLEAR